MRELLGDGLVVEVGRGASTGGKPRTLLQLNPPARYGVGVQLERNACVIVVVDLAGRPVARTSFHGMASLPPDRALPLVAAQVEALLTTAAVDRDKVLGVGLVGYGPLDRGAGVLLTPQPTGEWWDYPSGRSSSCRTNWHSVAADPRKGRGRVPAGADEAPDHSPSAQVRSTGE